MQLLAKLSTRVTITTTKHYSHNFLNRYHYQHQPSPPSHWNRMMGFFTKTITKSKATDATDDDSSGGGINSKRTFSSSTTKTATGPTIPVYIHSTLRDKNDQSEIVKPYGLQWGMEVQSHVAFVIAPDAHFNNDEEEENNNNNDNKTGIDDSYQPVSSSESVSLDNPKLRRGIVEAYNRWCCAKDIPYFVTEKDIESIEWWWPPSSIQNNKEEPNNKGNDNSSSKKTKQITPPPTTTTEKEIANFPPHIRVQWNSQNLKQKRYLNKVVPTFSHEELIQILKQDEAIVSAIGNEDDGFDDNNNNDDRYNDNNVGNASRAVKTAILADNESSSSFVATTTTTTSKSKPVEVWINGDYICTFTNNNNNNGNNSDNGNNVTSAKNMVDIVQTALAELTSKSQRKNWKRQNNNDDDNNDNGTTTTTSPPTPGMIRMERYYRGGIRRQPDIIYDHIWDNLVALEDPEIIDDHTLIGTATLNDWIMGGKLTSRLWIRDNENGNDNSILFLRPLRNDELDTSDRRYELKMQTNDNHDQKNNKVNVVDDDDNNEDVNEKTRKKMIMIRKELKRLRYLASLRHPFDVSEFEEQDNQKNNNNKYGNEDDSHKSRMAQIRSKLRGTKKKSKFFGL